MRSKCSVVIGGRAECAVLVPAGGVNDFVIQIPFTNPNMFSSNTVILGHRSTSTGIGEARTGTVVWVLENS
jgi:hypothetical protein